MFFLYMNNAGEDRFDVIRLLTSEYRMLFSDVKLILLGHRTRLMSGDHAQLRELQERLDEMGACSIIEFEDEEIAETDTGPLELS